MAQGIRPSARPQADATRLLATYVATRYRVRVPRIGSVDVRIGQPVPQALHRILEDERSFAILSACNPGSQPLAAADNHRRTRALVSRLRDESVAYLAAAGSLDGWREPGVCIVGMPLSELDSLARDLDQNAIIVGCRATPTRLRICRTAWRAMYGSGKPGMSDRIDWADASDGNPD